MFPPPTTVPPFTAACGRPRCPAAHKTARLSAHPVLSYNNIPVCQCLRTVVGGERPGASLGEPALTACRTHPDGMGPHADRTLPPKRDLPRTASCRNRGCKFGPNGKRTVRRPRKPGGTVRTKGEVKQLRQPDREGEVLLKSGSETTATAGTVTLKFSTNGNQSDCGSRNRNVNTLSERKRTVSRRPEPGLSCSAERNANQRPARASDSRACVVLLRLRSI